MFTRCVHTLGGRVPSCRCYCRGTSSSRCTRTLVCMLSPQSPCWTHYELGDTCPKQVHSQWEKKNDVNTRGHKEQSVICRRREGEATFDSFACRYTVSRAGLRGLAVAPSSPLPPLTTNPQPPPSLLLLLPALQKPLRRCATLWRRGRRRGGGGGEINELRGARCKDENHC